MAELMATEFQPIEYVVTGILPEGLTILAAPPKVGKSWLVLDLAYQLAIGGQALGAIPVDRPRPVLYLALEDSPRRLQDRLRQLNADEIAADLYFETTANPATVLADVRAFMAEHADNAPVVIVDTLGKIAPVAASGESDYQRDYRVGGALKAVADSVSGGSIIVVHHTRKAAAEDFLDTVSGTQGLAGSADSILVLRRDRNEARGSLSVTSRDAVEGEYAVIKDGVRWTLAAGDLTSAAVALAAERAKAGLGANSAAIIDYVNAHPEGVRAPEIALALGLNVDTVKHTLQRAAKAERISTSHRGLYVPAMPLSHVSLVSPLEGCVP